MNTVFIPILLNNGNTKDTITKLKEEITEVEEAYFEYKVNRTPETSKHLAEEVFDIAQLAVGMLSKLRDFEGIELGRANEHHIVKLANRHNWVFNSEFAKIRIPHTERK